MKKIVAAVVAALLVAIAVPVLAASSDDCSFFLLGLAISIVHTFF